MSTNLAKRGIKVLGDCPMCSTVPETMEHLLLRCPFARQIWALALLPWLTVSQFPGGMEDWLRLMKQELGKDDFSLLLILCWLIWGARNRMLFEGTPSITEDLVLQSRRTCQAFKGAMSRVV
ncbi:UNVERIFIED_CONTAM: hypothetical protein Sradi_3636100 [Sesamum radiatum]|uniref:Reverse transcriptase zinc-binding domain-containing protein n=1 Tax=Sesamum radiatum TaxID=300843 RepID=A0AAW2QHZ1_SESRA